MICGNVMAAPTLPRRRRAAAAVTFSMYLHTCYPYLHVMDEALSHIHTYVCCPGLPQEMASGLVYETDMFDAINILDTFLDKFLAISWTTSRRSTTRPSWPGCTSLNCPLSELLDAGVSDRSGWHVKQLWKRMLGLMHDLQPESLMWCSEDTRAAGVLTRAVSEPARTRTRTSARTPGRVPGPDREPSQGN